MPEKPQIYQVPAVYTDRESRLEDRIHRYLGVTVTRVFAQIPDDAKPGVGAVLMELSAALGGVTEDLRGVRLELAQRAYTDGRREGYEQCGTDLGLIAKPPDDAPLITH